MQRYFGEIVSGRAILSEGDVFHLTKVMRCQVGTEIQVVSDYRAFLAKVCSVKPLIIKVGKALIESRELKSDVILAIATLKGEKLDFVLQKATELGVHEIVLLDTSRTVAKFKARDIENKLTRYRRILKEASEQSMRTRIPLISGALDFKDIGTIRAHHKLIAYEELSGATASFNRAMQKIEDGQRVAVIIGPEGGFTPEEIDIAKAGGFKCVSLGRRILRAETAAIYALSVIANHLEIK